MKRYSILLICCLMIGLPVWAAPALDHPLHVPELISLALENHPSTRQAWWNAQRAAYAVGVSKSARLPDLRLNADFNHGRTFQFVNGPKTNYTEVDANLALSMLLLDFGETSADIQAAKMALLAANWQTDANVQQVIAHVLENVYNLFHARAVYEAAWITLQETQVVLEAVKQLNRAGAVPITDLYNSQASLAQAKMELTQQKALVDIQQAQLTSTLGVPAQTIVEIASLDRLPAPREANICELIELALKQRADLLAKRARHAEAIARQKQVAASYRPKVSVTAAAGASHYVHDKTQEGQFNIALNFDVPLFTGFQATYQKRMAYADTQASRAELAELELDISLEVFTYARNLQAAQESLPEADDYLENSIKAFEGIFEKYKAGKERIIELSSAQEQLAQARVYYSDVRTRWLLSLANLAYATGTLAPYREK